MTEVCCDRRRFLTGAAALGGVAGLALATTGIGRFLSGQAAFADYRGTAEQYPSPGPLSSMSGFYSAQWLWNTEGRQGVQNWVDIMANMVDWYNQAGVQITELLCHYGQGPLAGPVGLNPLSGTPDTNLTGDQSDANPNPPGIGWVIWLFGGYDASNVDWMNGPYFNASGCTVTDATVVAAAGTFVPTSTQVQCGYPSVIGLTVVGPGISAGTTVLTVSEDASTITLSNAATQSETNVTVTVCDPNDSPATMNDGGSGTGSMTQQLVGVNPPCTGNITYTHCHSDPSLGPAIQLSQGNKCDPGGLTSITGFGPFADITYTPYRFSVQIQWFDSNGVANLSGYETTVNACMASLAQSYGIYIDFASLVPGIGPFDSDSRNQSGTFWMLWLSGYTCGTDWTDGAAHELDTLQSGIQNASRSAVDSIVRTDVRGTLVVDIYNPNGIVKADV